MNETRIRNSHADPKQNVYARGGGEVNASTFTSGIVK